MSLRTQEKKELGFAVPISIKSMLSLPVVLMGGQRYSVHVLVLLFKFIWLILDTEVVCVFLERVNCLSVMGIQGS